jgi:hypothetical protein
MYRPAWRTLADTGAELAPVPVDSQGLVVDALAELIERRPIRAVYVTPHHQYPTTVTLSAGRRMALLELARRRRFAIIEDDYDHEFHYEGRPILPLASADDSGVVLYVGTLSKVLAPGLRVGYLIAPRAIRDWVIALRFDIDRQGDRLGDRALAELIEDGSCSGTSGACGAFTRGGAIIACASSAIRWRADSSLRYRPAGWRSGRRCIHRSPSTGCWRSAPRAASSSSREASSPGMDATPSTFDWVMRRTPRRALDRRAPAGGGRARSRGPFPAAFPASGLGFPHRVSRWMPSRSCSS